MINIQTAIDNTYHFKVHNECGAILLSSISYRDKNEIERAVEKLMALSLTRNHIERKTNTEGKFIFTLTNDDGVEIAYSEPYNSEAGMENGIKNLRENLNSVS